MRRKHDRITILLVEDNPGDAALVREMLLEAPGAPFAVQWSQRLSDALVHVTSGGVDAALVDLHLPDSTGLETFVQFQRAAPHLPVVILSGRDDEGFALHAVRAGAEDYLVKGTLAPEALARCVRYAVERRARRPGTESAPDRARKPRGRVLGFLGAKGGVGTTTVVANVAAALAARNRSVIAAELRGYHGTLAHHFGPRAPQRNLSSLLELSPEQVNEMELNSRIVKHSSACGVLYGPQRADEARPISGAHARRLVETLARMGRFVVLDLPPEPSEANREALRSCDFAGVVLDRERGCLEAARCTRDHLRTWGVKALIGAVVVHRSPLACPAELEEISRELDLGIAGLIPPAPDACAMAQKAGVPVVESYGDTLVADSLEKLASRLAEDPIVIKKTA